MTDGMPNFWKLEPRPDDVHSQVRFMVVVLVAKPQGQAQLAPHVPDLARRMFVVRRLGTDLACRRAAGNSNGIPIIDKLVQLKDTSVARIGMTTNRCESKNNKRAKSQHLLSPHQQIALPV
jgi:hypothetical protein